MTVITYGKSVTENAKSRRHARRRAAAMERERIESIIDAAFGIGAVEVAPVVEHHMSRIEKAVSSPSLRDKAEVELETKTCKILYSKPRTEYGVMAVGRQKFKGKSIPLI